MKEETVSQLCNVEETKNLTTMFTESYPGNTQGLCYQILKMG